MQRLACLFLVISAACGGGSPTGPAMLSGIDVKASAIEPFVGADAAGTRVHGWNILFYEQEEGGDCLEGTILAKISIYTNVPESMGPQALLTNGSSISIVTDNPPSVAGQAAAYMGVEGVGSIMGLVNIEDFHRTPDNMRGDNIVGSVNAGGFDGNQMDVALNGTFDAPLCSEQ